MAPRPLAVRERTEAIVRSVAAARAEDIAILIEPDLSAAADPDAFDRIVSNLIANALTYGEQPITVSAAVQDRHFRLTVEDRGPVYRRSSRRGSSTASRARTAPAPLAPASGSRSHRPTLGPTVVCCSTRTRILMEQASSSSSRLSRRPPTQAIPVGAPACIPLRARCVFRGWNTGRAGRGGLDPLEWTNASRPAGSRRGAGRVA